MARALDRSTLPAAAIGANGLRLLASLLSLALPLAAQSPPEWRFAVSGDSRNCGDVVMPAIAASVAKSGAAFYWHLGDFRAIYTIDEDMVPPASLHLNAPSLTKADYLAGAWPDFIQHQLKPFGAVEVFLAVGNHETIPPMSSAAYLKQFDPWLNSARLKAQRAADGDAAGARTYYHWVMNGTVDFLTLDNATNSAFDAGQMAWIRARLAADRNAPSIKTIVVGLHEALPGSKGLSHSMCDSSAGVLTGGEVYNLLYDLQQAGKKVYVVASHSHFVLEDVYRTPYWGAKVLPGWIVGAAGAVRYRLPPGLTGTAFAKTDVSGYLLATVHADGSIGFEFRELSLDDLRQANAGAVADALVGWCYAHNADQSIPKAGACVAH
jgi:hypothetical protein